MVIPSFFGLILWGFHMYYGVKLKATKPELNGIKMIKSIKGMKSNESMKSLKFLYQFWLKVKTLMPKTNVQVLENILS